MNAIMSTILNTNRCEHICHNMCPFAILTCQTKDKNEHLTVNVIGYLQSMALFLYDDVAKRLKALDCNSSIVGSTPTVIFHLFT